MIGCASQVAFQYVCQPPLFLHLFSHLTSAFCLFSQILLTIIYLNSESMHHLFSSHEKYMPCNKIHTMTNPHLLLLNNNQNPT
mmetsp:Transcript_24673/g.53225  ORF Transcript_24673/g.53225 Transcript_24673/m.53225 type:complete len:83 (-) Transcript_24673:37-285(-)